MGLPDWSPCYQPHSSHFGVGWPAWAVHYPLLSAPHLEVGWPGWGGCCHLSASLLRMGQLDWGFCCGVAQLVKCPHLHHGSFQKMICFCSWICLGKDFLLPLWIHFHSRSYCIFLAFLSLDGLNILGWLKDFQLDLKMRVLRVAKIPEVRLDACANNFVKVRVAFGNFRKLHNQITSGS